VTEPPTFASLDDDRSHVADAASWWPSLEAILSRHDLTDARADPVAGDNATWPTFVYGDVVVKLFGYLDRTFLDASGRQIAPLDELAAALFMV
jgi:hypothetical protein